MAESAFDRVSKSLNRNGRSIFAQMLSKSLEIDNLMEQGVIKLIFVPSDQYLITIIRHYNFTMEQFTQALLRQNIFQNQFSRDSSSAKSPVMGLKGRPIDIDQEGLRLMGATGQDDLGDILIVMTERFVIPEQELDSLLRFAKDYGTRGPGVLTLMRKDDLANINQLGGIHGKDLIALCISNPETNRLCNSADGYGRTIFHRLLQSEFGEIWPPFENARDRYIRRHTKKFLLIGHNYTRQSNLVTRFDGLITQYYGDSKLSNLAEIVSKYPRWQGSDYALAMRGISKDHKVLLIDSGISGINSRTLAIPDLDPTETPITAFSVAAIGVVITDKLSVYLYNLKVPKWYAFRNPDLELLSYANDGNGFLRIITRDKIDPTHPIKRQMFLHKFHAVTGLELMTFETIIPLNGGGISASSFKLVGPTFSYHIEIFEGQEGSPKYCLGNFNGRLFDSRQFPGGAFDFEHVQVDIVYSPPFPGDIVDDDIYRIPVIGILANDGRLWIGSTRVEDMTLYWTVLPSPDIIIDFNMADFLGDPHGDDDDYRFDLHILERSGRCRYMGIMVSSDRKDPIDIRVDRYYMHVPGLLSIKNHGINAAPLYLEVSDIY